MTTISVPGSNLPDFDAEWRTQEGAARAVEFEFVELIFKLNSDLLEPISTAFKKVTEQHKKSRDLNEKINSAYKRSKREIEEQKEAVKACNEKIEKCLGEKKHALTKAKEYRVKIKILERKYVEMGGSLDGLNATVARDIKQEERKRAAEETISKKTTGTPLAVPAHKRVRTGSQQ